MSDYYTVMMNQLTQWQYYLNQWVSSAIKQAQGDHAFGAYVTVIGIAFLYGLIHAAGPGHGKALVGAYFSKGKEDYRSAFTLGYLIAFIHALSAIAVTFILFFVVKTLIKQNFDQLYVQMMHISGVMILFIGVFIIYGALKEKKTNRQVSSKKSRYMMALSIGIVPCPGVMSIVLFCLLFKEYLLALLAALAMSVGMGITVSVVGILSVLFSKKTERFFKRAYLLEIVGGVLILLLGLFLIIS